jgi:hypothetical protein
MNQFIEQYLQHIQGIQWKLFNKGNMLKRKRDGNQETIKTSLQIDCVNSWFLISIFMSFNTTPTLVDETKIEVSGD